VPRPPGRLRSGEKLGHERLREAAGALVGGAELGFEGVAEGHEVIDPGDDARLLGERGKVHVEKRQATPSQMQDPGSGKMTLELSSVECCSEVVC
jgi:hypothetical protein